jgi:hypothetical protein
MTIKIKTRQGIIDPNVEPFVILFENNESVVKIAQMLLDMIQTPNSGQRKFAMFPDDMTQEEMEDFIEYGREIHTTIGMLTPPIEEVDISMDQYYELSTEEKMNLLNKIENSNKTIDTSKYFSEMDMAISGLEQLDFTVKSPNFQKIIDSI